MGILSDGLPIMRICANTHDFTVHHLCDSKCMNVYPKWWLAYYVYLCQCARYSLLLLWTKEHHQIYNLRSTLSATQEPCGSITEEQAWHGHNDVHECCSTGIRTSAERPQGLVTVIGEDIKINSHLLT
jgi:hypothetical protein